MVRALAHTPDCWSQAWCERLRAARAGRWPVSTVKMVRPVGRGGSRVLLGLSAVVPGGSALLGAVGERIDDALPCR